jgi:uncharacterized membrane protein YbhN (UPF0104 family)
MKQINAFITSILGQNWRTTVIGFIAAVTNLVANGVTWKTAIASVLMQSFGILAKDASTHSTIAQVESATDAARISQSGGAHS